MAGKATYVFVFTILQNQLVSVSNFIKSVRQARGIARVCIITYHC